MTTMRPSIFNAGSWKVKDLPQPVGATYLKQLKSVITFILGGRTTHKHEHPLRTKLMTSSCLSRNSSKPKTSFKMETFDSFGRFARRRSSEPGGYADDADDGTPAETEGATLAETLAGVFPLE
jgi:hypothetical protein